MGLHHKLCHVLGGLFNLSHSEMHAVILPYALAYNAPAISEGAMERLRRAVGTKEPAATLRALQRECGVPLSLAAIGMPGDGIDKAVDAIFEKPYANPRTPDRDSIRQLVRDAYSGKELG